MYHARGFVSILNCKLKLYVDEWEGGQGGEARRVRGRRGETTMLHHTQFHVATAMRNIQPLFPAPQPNIFCKKNVGRLEPSPDPRLPPDALALAKISGESFSVYFREGECTWGEPGIEASWSLGSRL